MTSTAPEALLEALTPDEGDLAVLRDRLASDAAARGLVDVAFTTVDSPVGQLLLAATDRGLVRVAYTGGAEEKALQELSERVSPRALRHGGRLDPVLRQLDRYFAGSLRRFDLPLDLRLAHGFRRQVVERLQDIGYGETVTYAAVAATTGRPRAIRAVGTACALNPLPLVVPCHRVVRSDGSPGQYAGGADAKRLLLALERSNQAT